MSDTVNRGSRGLAGNLQLGWNVWLFEMKWLFTGLLHRLQRRQLAGRLAEEQRRLGELEMASGSAEQMDLAREQAAFLEQEIERLDEEHAARRQFERSRKLQDWGLA